MERWRDEVAECGPRPATIVGTLSTVRNLYAYLEAGGYVVRIPASAKLVPSPRAQRVPVDDEANCASRPELALTGRLLLDSAGGSLRVWRASS